MCSSDLTFLTMAYIIFVNPQILSAAKMPIDAVFVSTCVAAAIGCFLMAFLANYPIALAPGMGLNAYFAFGVVGGMGHSWQVALGCVFVAELAARAGALAPEVVDRHRAAFGRVGLPTSWSGADFDTLLATMRVDKKARGNQLRFVVLEDLVINRGDLGPEAGLS